MRYDRIVLGHGSGGRLMHDLLDNLMLKELDNATLRQKRDSAVFKIGSKKIAFTTDSYVVNPVEFAGGDIGSLAVYGTINDLAVCGARPAAVSLALIIEEGFAKAALEKIIRSIRLAAKRAGVNIVTGDTKVVEKGACDKIFINTSGIGEVYYDTLSIDRIRPGDKVLVSGPIGDHAISVLSRREGIEFGTVVKSDSSPLYNLIHKILRMSRKVRFMRDPTRGGVATTLNEICMGRQFGISIDEASMPVREGTKNACELLGLDPLYLACEGRVIVITAKEDENRILKIMHRDKNGRMANSVGEIGREHKGRVYINTAAGGRRLVDMLSGEQLPRIC